MGIYEYIWVYMSIYEYIWVYIWVFCSFCQMCCIFDEFSKWSVPKVLKNLKKSSNMPKKLAKNEEKLWARRAGWHNLIHASQYQIHLLIFRNVFYDISFVYIYNYIFPTVVVVPTIKSHIVIVLQQYSWQQYA